jgi:tryptophan-rich sensory protein
MNQSPPALPRLRQWLGLACWQALAFATAAIGAVASVSSRELYAELLRPAWAPPGWLFGPVWTALYALMGVSACLVWRERSFAGARCGVGTQLAVNALWSWLFFAWRLGGAAFAEFLLLWGLIVATVIAYRRISALAAVLLLPYLAWVTFASALTFAVWRLNPALLG